MFLSFRKYKKQYAYPCKFFQKNEKGRRFIAKNVQIKSIFDVVVEIVKNP